MGSRSDSVAAGNEHDFKEASLGFDSLFLELLAWPTAAHAEAIGGDYSSYSPERKRFESPQRFALELRFGPYRPRIDTAFPQSRPFEKVFGDDNRVFFGVEFDWQALRIPNVGTLGPGFGWGYTHFGAPALLTGTNTPSAENTTLAVMPMYAVAVFRVDVARETQIPLVPYAKAGFGYALWWTGNDLGTSTRDGVVGRGKSFGTQMALGGMLLLDNFDEHAASELDGEVGINNTYVFFEWMFSNLDNFGSSNPSALRVGTSSWVLGLAFEM